MNKLYWFWFNQLQSIYTKNVYMRLMETVTQRPPKTITINSGNNKSNNKQFAIIMCRRQLPFVPMFFSMLYMTYGTINIYSPREYFVYTIIITHLTRNVIINAEYRLYFFPVGNEITLTDICQHIFLFILK